MDKSLFTNDYAVLLSELRSARERAGITQGQLAANLREISAWRRSAPMGVPTDANPRSGGKPPSGMVPG
ncbi:MAG: hypothetical protein NTV49_08140 [Kiritimatiellaeota bacterium]|nr:hypothetical protein [Kiritimatiellota bacterium]